MILVLISLKNQFYVILQIFVGIELIWYKLIDDNKYSKMNQERPEVVHSYETAVHEAFQRSLWYCAEKAESIESAHFSQCIKAAGINFATSYNQFFDFKSRRQQAMRQGIHD